ncbi:MAG: glycosyltransferase family 2 protein [Lachnospiraceae bacterium]|nr:glycosyltransferase family 2 protein [Lachnospiraceae bacterium]
MIDNNYSVDVIIPVYNPDAEFRKVIELLKIQTYPINKIIIMNTEERYWNPMLERDNSVLEVHHVTKAEFDHGATRSEGASYSSADIIVFMTQDALPDNNYLIEELIKPFEPGFKTDVPVAASYARQLPNEECGVIERYTRSFNYPEASVVKSAKDVEKLGIKTFFCSNVCAAYKKEYFDKLGGFIKKTIFNEDMIFAGHAVKAGYAIAYQADARVIHSHNYTCMQQLHRNFDLAVSQADNPDVFKDVPSESEGIKLVKQTAKYLFKIKKPWLVFELVFKSGFKYLGYLLGKRYKKLPKKMVLACTMNKEYWKR